MVRGGSFNTFVAAKLALQCVSVPGFTDRMEGMFTVDEATAEAIRRACENGGELAGVVELRRHYPLLADNANARLCVRAIAGWKPMADRSQVPSRRRSSKKTVPR